jgi:lipopolysaccharide biosynthesis protein
MDDPKKFGFDASVEFPPHHMDAKADPKDFKPVIGFSGAVHDYVKAILKYVAKPIPAFTRFRSVMVGWDNTPRRKQNSTSFIRSSPAAYEAWLKQTLLDTKEQNSGDERIVFINAWNEWAEGTYLEPDRKHGHAYLQATQNALEADLILEK